MRVTFRDAVEADLPGIVALLADDVLGGGRERPGPPLPEAYRVGFRRMVERGGSVVLMEDGGELAGCLQLDVLYGVSTLGMARAQVEGVRVARARRGQGLGRLLLAEAVRRARDAGCGVVQLTTNLSRTEAQRFYRSMGFEQSHLGFKLAL